MIPKPVPTFGIIRCSSTNFRSKSVSWYESGGGFDGLEAAACCNYLGTYLGTGFVANRFPDFGAYAPAAYARQGNLAGIGKGYALPPQA
jgi:hypothetical protein